MTHNSLIPERINRKHDLSKFSDACLVSFIRFNNPIIEGSGIYLFRRLPFVWIHNTIHGNKIFQKKE